MTMEEIYRDPDKWVREMEEEADWLRDYGPELEEAWAELDELRED